MDDILNKDKEEKSLFKKGMVSITKKGINTTFILQIRKGD